MSIEGLPTTRHPLSRSSPTPKKVKQQHCVPTNLLPPPPSLILQSYQYLPPPLPLQNTISQLIPQASSPPKSNEKRARSKKCFKWNDELEQKFIQAMNKLGVGAKPSQIQKEMGVPHLSRSQISSHLQKYRTLASESVEENNAALPLDVIMKREILGFDVNQEDFLLSMVDLVDLIQQERYCDCEGSGIVPL
eukprot:TRINITY_DN3229_c0_g2_i3.p1 TRINITY_DN3229_c0_g2~~TRINITY_DN3229_c0_g2_i3.p1  ORF type:complete len:192 (-),score=31.48 TRINITY_DN3229_c0_g2_i3:1275-1850(-)